MLGPRLRHRIDIELLVRSRNTDGELVDTWQLLESDVPAEVKDVSGKDLIASMAGQQRITSRAVVRYRSLFTTGTLRVVHAGQVYSVVAPLADPQGTRWLTLMLDRGVTDGR